MQAVGDLDEDHTGIITDGQQELTDILRLQTIDVLRYLLGGDLRKTFDDLGDLIAEATADILYGVLCILDDIVQECAADRGRSEADLLAYDTGYCDGMQDIGLTTAPAYQPMSMTSQAEGLINDLSLLSVR